MDYLNREPDEDKIDEEDLNQRRKNKCLIICLIIMIVLMLPSTLALLAIF